MLREKRIFFTHAPQVYLSDSALSRKLINGEKITEKQAVKRYFERIKRADKKYWILLLKLYKQKADQFPESFNAIPSHRLQIITPAYREGENLRHYFKGLLKQFKETPSNWGVTIVINYEIPYKNLNEPNAAKVMEDGISKFRYDYPEYCSQLDYVTYATNGNMETPILPNSMARKVGEDLTMLCWLSKKDINVPKYLGMLDMDGDLSKSSLLKEVLNLLPTTIESKPVIIRSKGTIDKEAVRKNRHMFIFQIMWEEGISAVGRLTHHNPFALGRFGIFPTREYAISGGGMPKKLRFIDEDVRRGIQIAWRFPIRLLETKNVYSTSSRRELHLMNALRKMVLDNNGKFTIEIMETAAMIRMYNNLVWATHDYRKHLRNLARSPNGSMSDFSREVPSQLIEAMSNSWSKFTLFSMFAIDSLWTNPDTPEIMNMREKFLSGTISYLDVQIGTYTLLQKISKNDLARFKRIAPILKNVDNKVRGIICHILRKYQITFREIQSERARSILTIPLGVKHGHAEDQQEIPLSFRILSRQSRLASLIDAETK